MKILVSDYDQTLYLDDEGINENKKAIEKFRQKGNLFVIATGRSYMDFKKKSDLYDLKYDYVIINHGATILDNEDRIILNVSIDNNVIENIKKDINLEKTISNFCCSTLESRVDFDHKDLTKIEAKYENKEEAWNINKRINEKYNNFVNSYFLPSNAIEMISNKTNKSFAIKHLVQNLNIQSEDIYTVGDGYSDIDMIKDFKGFAMEDSVSELKELSLGIVKSVAELIYKIMK